MFSRQQYEAVTTAAGATELNRRGRLRLTGRDRRGYLQGLLTNDIVALEPGSGCYAALLTPQGRMITDMRVLELGDAVLLDLPREGAEPVRDRLDQFIFAEDVQVENVTERWPALGVYGPSASSIVATALARTGDASQLESLAPFGSVNWAWNASSVVVARNDDYGVPGFDLYAQKPIAQGLAASLRQAGAADLGAEALEVLRIEAGTPAFGADMNEETIPLEAGIQDRAISLTKGCYVGQEIIIRVLHRGHGRVARRLVGLSMQPGVPVPARDDRIAKEAREVGAVTSAAWSPALGRPIALGYVHRDCADVDTTVSIAHGHEALAAVVVALPFIRRGAG
jgi:folate-binding protein YgfZ